MLSLLFAAALPGPVTDALAKKYPAGQVVASVACGTNTYGAILTNAKPLTANDVIPVIVVGSDVFEIPQGVEVAGLGAQRNHFDEFVDQGKLTGPPDFRCTHPKKDPDVMEKLGKYTHKDKKLRAAQHICFAISNTYNNWACYVFDGKPKLSFAQMQAD